MCGVGATVGSWLSSIVTGKSLLSSQSTPSSTTVSAAPTTVAGTGDDALNAANDAKKKAALLKGQASTIATSSQGDLSTPTTKKSLLGG
jgi:hypothetical protein